MSSIGDFQYLYKRFDITRGACKIWKVHGKMLMYMHRCILKQVIHFQMQPLVVDLSLRIFTTWTLTNVPKGKWTNKLLDKLYLAILKSIKARSNVLEICLNSRFAQCRRHLCVQNFTKSLGFLFSTFVQRAMEERSKKCLNFQFISWKDLKF